MLSGWHVTGGLLALLPASYRHNPSSGLHAWVVGVDSRPLICVIALHAICHLCLLTRPSQGTSCSWLLPLLSRFKCSDLVVDSKVAMRKYYHARPLCNKQHKVHLCTAAYKVCICEIKQRTLHAVHGAWICSVISTPVVRIRPFSSTMFNVFSVFSLLFVAQTRDPNLACATGTVDNENTGKSHSFSDPRRPITAFHAWGSLTVLTRNLSYRRGDG